MAGPTRARLLIALDERLPPWDRRIDILVLTHPHEDHVAGLALLLQRYRVGRVYEPGMLGTRSRLRRVGGRACGRRAAARPPLDRRSADPRRDPISRALAGPEPCPGAPQRYRDRHQQRLDRAARRGRRPAVPARRRRRGGRRSGAPRPRPAAGGPAQGRPPRVTDRVDARVPRGRPADGRRRVVGRRQPVRPPGAATRSSGSASSPGERIGPTRTARSRSRFDAGGLRVRTTGPRTRPRQTPATDGRGAWWRPSARQRPATQFLCGIPAAAPESPGRPVIEPPVAPEAPPSPLLASLGRSAAAPPGRPSLGRLPDPKIGVRTVTRYHRPDADSPVSGDRGRARDRSPRLLLGRRRVRPRGRARRVPQRRGPLPRRPAGALATRRPSAPNPPASSVRFASAWPRARCSAAGASRSCAAPAG